MSNQFRSKKEEQEEELPREEKVTREPVKESKTIALFRKFFTEGVITKESATDMLPFLVFVCVLVMIYIANSHMAISNIRKIGTLNKEVKELSWEYKSLKADLMFKSKLTEVAKKVDTLGIKELIEPPKKIIVKSNEH
ncbi:MAG: hypothetical protein EOO42_06295 [Flavobacteriales bacterium]|nr:MAG: hypothetical protein EOO42_06295 [Flavobacteriales bacterium]